ncbi:hypothetical protein KM043_011138 [Ampulex compressa]|nr:hypothetical protein KM043_011138 [Ampulex compressa]
MPAYLQSGAAQYSQEHGIPAAPPQKSMLRPFVAQKRVHLPICRSASRPRSAQPRRGILRCPTAITADTIKRNDDNNEAPAAPAAGIQRLALSPGRSTFRQGISAVCAGP